jgi:hypothetical protein
MARSDRELDKADNRREKARENRSRRNSLAGSMDITNLDPLPLLALVYAFAADGGAVRIGYSRDGGSLAVGCYMGNDYSTEYVRPNELFDSACQEIAEAWLPNQGQEYHRQLNILKQRVSDR